MKVFTRVDGINAGLPFVFGCGNAIMFHCGKWKESGWTNRALLDKSLFRLMGNNFRLK